jgi:hypothetical protein
LEGSSPIRRLRYPPSPPSGDPSPCSIATKAGWSDDSLALEQSVEPMTIGVVPYGDCVSMHFVARSRKMSSFAARVTVPGT